MAMAGGLPRQRGLGDCAGPVCFRDRSLLPARGRAAVLLRRRAAAVKQPAGRAPAAARRHRPSQLLCRASARRSPPIRRSRCWHQRSGRPMRPGAPSWLSCRAVARMPSRRPRWNLSTSGYRSNRATAQILCAEACRICLSVRLRRKRSRPGRSTAEKVTGTFSPQICLSVRLCPSFSSESDVGASSWLPHRRFEARRVLS